MILVTGANGNYGLATIKALLAKGCDPKDVAGLVRDKAKAAELAALGVGVRVGDYSSPASLIEAFKRVDTLLLISGTDLQNRSHQQRDVIDAAKASGIKHLVYTSVGRKDESGHNPLSFLLSSHLATEYAIKASGIPYTILRNNLYMEMLPWFIGEQFRKNGIFLPAGEGKISFALRTDMAEATAGILLSEGHENKEYDISGVEAISFQQVAAILTDITGKNVPYYSPSAEDYLLALKQAGVPDEYAGFFAGFSKAASTGDLEADKTDLPQLLGRIPVSVEAFLWQLYGQADNRG